jgi:predicted nucleic acid-binding protein
MRVLVDTSVWSLALRRGRAIASAPVDELRNLIADHRVEMMGAIRQELLSGIRDETQFKELERRLAAFPDLSILSEDYVTAARFFNRCRARGIQGSNTDFLICAVAVRLGLAIYTTDDDFVQFARYLPIMLHAPARSGPLR